MSATVYLVKPLTGPFRQSQEAGMFPYIEFDIQVGARVLLVLELVASPQQPLVGKVLILLFGECGSHELLGGFGGFLVRIVLVWQGLAKAAGSSREQSGREPRQPVGLESQTPILRGRYARHSSEQTSLSNARA